MELVREGVRGGINVLDLMRSGGLFAFISVRFSV